MKEKLFLCLKNLISEVTEQMKQILLGLQATVQLGSLQTVPLQKAD
jgi:hypothetical protein